jgi:type IV pilus assembly protein PilE
MSRHTRGFTLIELMIALVIVAILAGIAVPSYRNYVLRSHRVEATAALLKVAAAQEKFYLQNNTYTENVGKVAGLGLSTDDNTDNFATENGWYKITVTDADTEAFSVKAEAQAKDGQTDDIECLEFTLESSGKKTASGDGCWKR